jgi:hypothetical protein
MSKKIFIKSIFLTLVIILFQSTVIAAINSADDWAKPGIESALEKGFVPDDIQGNYTSVITRAEFCRMAIKFVEYHTGKNINAVLSEKNLSRNNNAFNDTNDLDILAAYALGITNGTVAPTATIPGMFTPDGQFSREQAATMIRNICRVLGIDTANPPDSNFADLEIASDWAVEGINFVRANGIMQGTSGNNFSPKRTYTRQESIFTFNNMSVELLKEPETEAPTHPSTQSEDNNIMYLHIGERVLTATFADNSSAEALKKLLAAGDITINMSDYGGFEKVGSLGTNLPTNNVSITSEPGDLILYQGNQLVIFYAPNTWSYTRLGKINNVTHEELRTILGSGNVTVTLSLTP